MLGSESDQVANVDPAEAGAAAPLDDGAEELTALGEADRVELARRVQHGVGQVGELGQLVAAGGDLVIREAEEGGAPVNPRGRPCQPLSHPREELASALICWAVLCELYDVDVDAFELGTRFEVGLDGFESRVVEAVAEAVPDLRVGVTVVSARALGTV